MLAFLVVIGIVVVFHELGHFWVAKVEKVKVKEFAIGFGPIIFSKRKGDLLYSIRLLPLGGFVRLFGETPEESGEGSFLESSPWSRFKIIGAGPLMNFLLALLMFYLVFLFNGYPNLNVCKVGEVLSSSPAEKAGLKPGDEIIAVNNIKVSKWKELATIIHSKPGEKLRLEVLRKERKLFIEVTPEYNPNLRVGLIGVAPWIEKYNFLGSMLYSTKYTLSVSYFMLNAIGRMVLRKERVDIRGPVAVAQLAGQAAKSGWFNFLSFIGIISVNLAFINLFPLPALDGGRLLFIAFEIFFHKRLDPKYEGIIHYIGFIILIALMLFVTYRDVVSLR
ncbi:MAG: RIP metalloprotease RseP [Synergistetes bacterium]|nr:RIP metalloprotease RseP [Synergistota bacterium]MCX8127941.1 RIP metalloprotease RseP [Synergistota bacterium]MDW8192018.1 RIP metalloprotease RseP [Synergistota bacterium]